MDEAHGSGVGDVRYLPPAVASIPLALMLEIDGKHKSRDSCSRRDSVIVAADWLEQHDQGPIRYLLGWLTTKLRRNLVAQICIRLASAKRSVCAQEISLAFGCGKSTAHLVLELMKDGGILHKTPACNWHPAFYRFRLRYGQEEISMRRRSSHNCKTWRYVSGMATCPHGYQIDPGGKIYEPDRRSLAHARKVHGKIVKLRKRTQA